MIKNIVAHIKTDYLEILFRMDSGHFYDQIITTIESAGCQYLIKGKEYPTLTSQVTAPTISFTKGDKNREITELVTKLNTWDKDRRFVVSHVLKPEKNRSQLSFLEGSDYKHFYFVTNTELSSEKVVIAYAKCSSREKRGNTEYYINTLNGHREAKSNMAVGRLLLKSFWDNEPYSKR